MGLMPPSKKQFFEKISGLGWVQDILDFFCFSHEGVVYLNGGDKMPRNKTCTASIYRNSDNYRELKSDMLDDLEARGLIGKKYTDKVEEYMNLWSWLQMLNDDIMRRGVYIEYSNGATQKGTTDNKSLTIAVRVSSQMLNIWTSLGFREQAVKSTGLQSGGDDDEL